MVKAFFAIAAVAGALAIGIGPASAAPLACGATVTTSVTLTADLLNCAGDGLIAGASRITINLNGHTIDGTGTLGSAGVRASGRTLVTVRGPGATTDFDTGVNAATSGGVIVSQVTLIGNTTGVSASGSGFRLTRGTVTGNVTGAAFSFCDYCLVTTSSIFGNSGTGVSASASTRIYVAGNSISGNGGPGIALTNTLTNQIQQNSVSSNFGGGIEFLNADRNTITENLVTGTILGDGIFVDAFSSTSFIKNNRANGNFDDGIDVDNSATLIRWNVANANGNYGIEAVPGVIDGGLNQAGGNGAPAQCLFVHCS
jgi:parallel beta-helix repeat protein